MYNSSWAPTKETSYQIFTEDTWLQGALLSNIAYGVELALFAMCFHLLIAQMNRRNKKRQFCLLSFISILFVLGTTFVGGSMKFAQQAFVEYRNFPGGPAAFEQAMFSDPVDELANVSWVVGNWFMDIFLVSQFLQDRTKSLNRRLGLAFCSHLPGHNQTMALDTAAFTLSHASCFHWCV